MSKLLKTFDDEKDINTFMGMINDINQIAKNFKSDNVYSMKDGVCYAYKSLTKDVIHQELYMDFSSNRNKKAYNDDIQLLNGIINGKKLFNFFKELKEAKKHPSQISLYDDYFIINIANTTVNFCSDKLTVQTRNIDINKINDYKKRIKIDDKPTILFTDDNFENVIVDSNLCNAAIPYEHKFTYSKKDKSGNIKKKTVKFRITTRMFPTYKKTSKVKLYGYAIDLKNKVYQIVYEINNGTSIVKNYATIINY